MTTYYKAAANLLGLDPQEIIIAGIKYLETREAEKTNREWIRANSQMFQAALQAQQETILAYFEHSFAERREALAEFYRLLHTAVDTKNAQQLDGAICGILGIIKHNPLHDFDHFKKTWNDPNAIIEL